MKNGTSSYNVCYDKNLDEIKRPAIGGIPICVSPLYLFMEGA